VADADSGSDFDWAGRPRVISKLQRRARIEQIEAVMSCAGDCKRPAQAAWTSGEPGIESGIESGVESGVESGICGVRWQLAIDGHRFASQDRFQSADEDATGFAFRLAGDIDAVIHAIDEIDVGVTRRPEHYAIARRNTAKAVGRRVWRGSDVRAQVGFHLDNASREPACVGAMGEQLAKQDGRNDFRRFFEEPPGDFCPASRKLCWSCFYVGCGHGSDQALWAWMAARTSSAWPSGLTLGKICKSF